VATFLLPRFVERQGGDTHMNITEMVNQLDSNIKSKPLGILWGDGRFAMYQFKDEFNSSLLYAEYIAEIEKRIENNTVDATNVGYYRAYLAVLYFLISDYNTAKKMIDVCLESDINDEFRNEVINFSNQLGLRDFYDDWTVKETENFFFRYRLGEGNKINLDEFAFQREEALKYIQSIFNVSLLKKIDFFIWDSREEAHKQLQRQLGFAYSMFNVIHSSFDQTLGHEITHIITGYLYTQGKFDLFINEGIAVYLDQSNRNRLAHARLCLSHCNIMNVKVMDVWKGLRDFPQPVSYAVAAVFIERLLNGYGQEKLIQLITNQSCEDANNIYGRDDFEKLICELESDLQIEEYVSSIII